MILDTNKRYKPFIFGIENINIKVSSDNTLPVRVCMSFEFTAVVLL